MSFALPDRVRQSALEFVIHNKLNKFTQLLEEYLPELIERKLNTNGDTLLMTACHYGHFNIVKLLANKGAILTRRNEQSQTLAALACYTNKSNGLYYLNRSAITKTKKTDSSVLKILKLLSDSDFNFDTTDVDGDSPLSEAIKSGFSSSTAYLIDAYYQSNVLEKHLQSQDVFGQTLLSHLFNERYFAAINAYRKESHPVASNAFFIDSTMAALQKLTPAFVLALALVRACVTLYSKSINFHNCLGYLKRSLSNCEEPINFDELAEQIFITNCYHATHGPDTSFNGRVLLEENACDDWGFKIFNPRDVHLLKDLVGIGMNVTTYEQFVSDMNATARHNIDKKGISFDRVVLETKNDMLDLIKANKIVVAIENGRWPELTEAEYKVLPYTDESFWAMVSSIIKDRICFEICKTIIKKKSSDDENSTVTEQLERQNNRNRLDNLIKYFVESRNKAVIDAVDIWQILKYRVDNENDFDASIKSVIEKHNGDLTKLIKNDNPELLLSSWRDTITTRIDETTVKILRLLDPDMSINLPARYVALCSARKREPDNLTTRICLPTKLADNYKELREKYGLFDLINSNKMLTNIDTQNLPDYYRDNPESLICGLQLYVTLKNRGNRLIRVLLKPIDKLFLEIKNLYKIIDHYSYIYNCKFSQSIIDNLLTPNYAHLQTLLDKKVSDESFTNLIERALEMRELLSNLQSFSKLPNLFSIYQLDIVIDKCLSRYDELNNFIRLHNENIDVNKLHLKLSLKFK